MTAPALTGARPVATIIARVAAAVFGNYAASSTAGALLAVVLSGGGMARSDAVVTASIVTILGYLIVLIWAFHARRLARLWTVLAGLTVVCMALTRLIGPGAA